MERIAGDDGGAAVAAKEPGERADVFAGVLAVEGENGLSGEVEGVGEGYADAAVADVEAERAGGAGRREWGLLLRRHGVHGSGRGVGLVRSLGAGFCGSHISGARCGAPARRVRLEEGRSIAALRVTGWFAVGIMRFVSLASTHVMAA
jgi:hypothetical protein